MKTTRVLPFTLVVLLLFSSAMAVEAAEIPWLTGAFGWDITSPLLNPSGLFLPLGASVGSFQVSEATSPWVIAGTFDSNKSSPLAATRASARRGRVCQPSAARSPR